MIEKLPTPYGLVRCKKKNKLNFQKMELLLIIQKLKMLQMNLIKLLNMKILLFLEMSKLETI